MSEQIRISVVIPVPSGTFPLKVINYLLKADYPTELIEVIVVEGNNPSLQRNEAVQSATSDIIYFLDDDSFVEPGAIKEGLKYLAIESVVAVGGPAVAYKDATLLESCFAEIMGSVLGSFVTRTRFRPVGLPRQVLGDELILCNMMLKKFYFLEIHGFDTRVYPNEENEFLKRIRQAGWEYFYNPKMVISRHPRRTIVDFIAQALNYSHGRAKHILFGLHYKDLAFFAPSCFLIYLILFLLFPSFWFSVPLLVYMLLVAASSAAIAWTKRSHKMFCLLVPLYFVLHLSYGLGLMSGWLKVKHELNQQRETVRLTRRLLEDYANQSAD